MTCFFKPELGLYTCIALAFIISVFERILYGIITLDFFVEILGIGVVAGMAYKKRLEGESFWKNFAHPVNYVLIGFLLYQVMEIFNPNGSSAAVGLFIFRKTAQALIIYVLALNIFQSIKKTQEFLNFWIIVSGLCGAYACYQQWIGFPAFELNWIRSSELRIDIYQLDNGSFRKFSTLTDPAAFGILMAVSALLTMVTILKNPFKRNKIIYSAALLFQLLGMFYSGTRTATGALIAGIALYILMTINEVKTLIFAVFCSLVIGFLLFAPIYGNVTINRFRSTFQFTNDNSNEVRNINRARVQPYILSHPIGGGMLSSGNQGKQYYPGHYLAGFPSDSGFLKVAVEIGWIGLLIVCTLYFTILQQGARAFYRNKDPLAKAILLAAVVALFGNIVSEYSQVSIGPSPQIFLYYPLIATIVVLSQLRNKEKIHL